MHVRWRDGAIARSLMSCPWLLIFEEPSLGLAPVVVPQVFAIIRRLAKQRLTILLVEQNRKKALEVADRGYGVETGWITMLGPARELLSNEGIRASDRHLTLTRSRRPGGVRQCPDAGRKATAGLPRRRRRTGRLQAPRPSCSSPKGEPFFKDGFGE